MGYIPALFVFFSGGFLWGIVVYNTLKQKRADLFNKLSNIQALAAERNRVIQAILNESTPSEIGDLVDDPFVKIQAIDYQLNQNFLNEESKARMWIKDLIANLNQQEEKKISLSSLISASSVVDQELIEYVKIGKGYNSLVTSKPTSYMASLLNFKPISLS